MLRPPSQSQHDHLMKTTSANRSDAMDIMTLPTAPTKGVILVVDDDERDEARALAKYCSVSDVLTKPVPRSELLATIDAACACSTAPTRVQVPNGEFDEEHRRLLTDKLASKVAELEAALKASKAKEAELLKTVHETIKTEQALEETNRDLLRKNQEIQNFYHTVSHELKTPLTAAREFISILIDGLAGPLEPVPQEYLRIARESCDRLRICIDDLMDATRLETGKLRLEMKPSSLSALIRKLVLTLGPVAARKQISLTEEVQPDLPDFPFDENRLMQVLANLVNNALKFTPEKGSVSIAAGEAPDDPEAVRILIKDTGCGLPSEEADRIFERLYQVPVPDGGSSQGVGLGLYICRELVHSHGGEIWVDSQLGVGSTFCVEIPKVTPSEALHVLFVDDDSRMRELMSRVLTRTGFDVTTAEDGTLALQQMKRSLPDVVITDLAMPNTDGVELLKEIRQQWGLLPVIILTGCSPDAAAMRRAMEFSPFTLLAKPCPTEQLIKTICSLRHKAVSCSAGKTGTLVRPLCNSAARRKKI